MKTMNLMILNHQKLLMKLIKEENTMIKEFTKTFETAVKTVEKGEKTLLNIEA